VLHVNMPIIRLLSEARKFTNAQGIPQAGFGTGLVAPSRVTTPPKKAGEAQEGDNVSECLKEVEGALDRLSEELTHRHRHVVERHVPG
jgi:hypothetical protein